MAIANTNAKATTALPPGVRPSSCAHLRKLPTGRAVPAWEAWGSDPRFERCPLCGETRKVRVKTIAHPVARRVDIADVATMQLPAVTTPAKPSPKTRRTLGDTMTEYQRLEAEEARTVHERAYWRHVALPLCSEGFPAPRPQYKNLIPGRRFVFDFAYIEAQLVIEIHGQIWRLGGHTSGRGLSRDAVKLDEATALGWRYLVFTPEMITSGEAKDYTERALRAAGLKTRPWVCPI